MKQFISTPFQTNNPQYATISIASKQTTQHQEHLFLVANPMGAMMTFNAVDQSVTVWTGEVTNYEEQEWVLEKDHPTVLPQVWSTWFNWKRNFNLTGVSFAVGKVPKLFRGFHWPILNNAPVPVTTWPNICIPERGLNPTGRKSPSVLF